MAKVVQNRAAPILIVFVVVVIIFGFISFRPVSRPDPIYPIPDINPTPSYLDQLQYTEIRLEGGGEDSSRLDVSVHSVSFWTSSKDICLFGNFSVVGDGDGFIDFLILTDGGYADYMEDGQLDNSDLSYTIVFDTSGEYWCHVLPYYYNGHTVQRWYIVYSAFQKLGPRWFIIDIPAEYRDVGARDYRDFTPPNRAHSQLPENVTDILELDLWAWDDRCSVSSVSVFANEILVQEWKGLWTTFHETFEWDVSGWIPGNYSLTMYVMDVVGNDYNYSMGMIEIPEPPDIFETVIYVLDIVAIPFGFFSIFVAFFSLIRSNKVTIILSLSISVTSVVGNFHSVFGPLELFNIIAGVIGITSGIITITGYILRKREAARYKLRGEADYIG